MNIRLITLLIALITLPALAQAAGKSAAVANKATVMQNSKNSTSITSNQQQYQLLTDVRAAEKLGGEQPQQTVARASGGKLVETKGSFVIFTAAPQTKASVNSSFGTTSYPTVMNLHTQGIGILPGTLSVKLKNMSNATAVANDHGLGVVRVFAHLQAVFYRVKPGQDVVVAAASLSSDPRVASAEVEVIENVATSQ